MRFQKYLLAILLIAFSIQATEFQDFLNRVNSVNNPADKQAIVDSFLVHADSVGVPFVEGTTASFIYSGNVSTAQVAGDFNGWNGTSMTLVGGTNFFYLTRTFEIDARFDYKLIVNGSWILDPRNPNTVRGLFINSELSMPEYAQPTEIISNPDIPHGTRVNFSIASSVMGRNYNIYVYLPPSYDSLSSTTYPTVYFQDGSDYINFGYAINILDNLIAKNRIEEVIAVFARPYDRNDEYAYSNRYNYAQYFVEELVPHIDSTFNTIPTPQKRMVMGDSFGGNISGLISYEYPEVFALCGLHSGAFWPNNYEVYDMIVNGDKKDIKYYSVWGSYEGSLTANMNTFMNEMTSLGYEIDGKEFHEGHSWGLWRATTDLILEYFFPGIATGVEEEIVANNFMLHQNYPNPFNPSTTIKFTTTSPSFPLLTKERDERVRLEIYNSVGQKVTTLINESMPSGNHEVTFDASGLPTGIYFYTLNIDGRIQTKKMALIK